jgi:glycosyl transferase family 87
LTTIEAHGDVTNTTAPRFRPTSRQIIVLAVGLLSLGLSLNQLATPEILSSYDTGVYLAATIHFISGVMPYRDFTFVQPPGILLLMSPAAVFGRIFGTHDAFELVRVIGAVFTALNASLIAWIVRRRGSIAMVIAGVGLALSPVAFWVSSSLTLEPFCLFFVLVGTALVFARDDEDATTKYLIVAGVFLGIAGAIKLWAVIPFIALVVCLTPRYRKRVVAFVIGAAASFVVLCLPFLLLAPSNFVSQVFTEQLLRKAPPYEAASILNRLIVLTGFQPTTAAPTKLEALAAFIVLGLVALWAFRHRLSHDAADYFFLITAALSVIALLSTKEFFFYYGYFSAPFLWAVAGISLARLIRPVRERVAALPVRRSVRQLFAIVSAAIGGLFLFAMVLYVSSFYSAYAFVSGVYGPWLSQVAEYVPSGSCVVYAEVSYGVYANRFFTNDPRCPVIVDPYGMYMKWGYQVTPPTKAYADQWRGYFERAQYVVLSLPDDANIPWTTSLHAYFNGHYHEVLGKNYIYIYRRDATPLT